MSASKGQWAGASAGAGSGGGREWVDASSRRPCDVCGKRSWCQLHRDGGVSEGGVTLCKRVPSDLPAHTNREGAEFWVHRSPSAARKAAADLGPAARPGVERANIDVRHRAYTAALAALPLEGWALADLCDRRGMSRETVATAGYRCIPDHARRDDVVRAIQRAVGEEAALRVPGVQRREQDGRSYLTFGGAIGTVIPCRNREGMIFALKVRARDGDDRYHYISSSWYGGPAAEVGIHVPLAALAVERPKYVVVSEGEILADLCTQYLRQPVVAVPGVSNWRGVSPLAMWWGAPKVIVAYDADLHRVKEVKRARDALLSDLQSYGFATSTWEWPEAEGCGLDDYLTARARRRAGDTAHRGGP